MPFKYNKLWEKLNDRNMTKTDLRIMIGVSQTTIANMGKNKNVHLDVIDKICDCMHCTPDEIIDYCENEEEKYKIGDIVLTDFGENNKKTFSGIRPALIVNKDKKNFNESNLIVIPLTTNTLRNKHTAHIELNQSDGLNIKSYALLEHMRIIDKKNILFYIGHKEFNCDESKCLNEIIKEFADSKGESVNGFINTAIDEKMEKDK